MTTTSNPRRLASLLIVFFFGHAFIVGCKGTSQSHTSCKDESHTQVTSTSHDPYHSARQAGYLDLEEKGRLEAPTVLLAVKDLPESGLQKIATQQAWDKFVEQFGRIDKDSKGPAFTSRNKPIRFDPDFKKEALLIVSTKMDQAQFSEIEVFRKNERLDLFVFFGGNTFDLSVNPYGGEHIYIVRVPRGLAEKRVECRIAYQSWGRPCSKFSPAMVLDEQH